MGRAVLFLALGLLLGAGAGFGGGGAYFQYLTRQEAKRDQATVAADPACDIAFWKYPNAVSSSSSTSGGATFGHVTVPPCSSEVFATSDSFDEVLAFYSAKLGGFALNRGGMTSTSSATGADFTDTFTSGVLQHATTGAERSVRALSFCHRKRGFDLTVFIHRARDEEQTWVSLYLVPRYQRGGP